MLFRYGGSAQIGAATTDFAMLVLRPRRSARTDVVC